MLKTFSKHHYHLSTSKKVDQTINRPGITGGRDLNETVQPVLKKDHMSSTNKSVELSHIEVEEDLRKLPTNLTKSIK